MLFHKKILMIYKYGKTGSEDAMKNSIM
jgi:hypothetical protein